MIDEAKAVLAANWRDGYTVPHGALYPFQWLWDSGFTALGYGHFDVDRAKEELQSLFGGQWRNGFLPHIVFHEDDPGYFPGPGEWRIAGAPGGPPGVATSGITQPPVIGFILEMMVERVSDRAALLPFVDELYPRIVRFHRYLHASRDPGGEGLVYIQHPWESGADNSPLWDGALAAVEPRPSLADIEVRRRDTTHVGGKERPSSIDYQRYLHLVHVFRDCRYADECIARESPFLVQDASFNAILIRSDRALVALGRLLGHDVAEIEEWEAAGRAAMNAKLWNAEDRVYDGFDLRAGTRLRARAALGALAPLFAGVPDSERAASMIDALQERFGSPEHYWCATVSPADTAFEPTRYWRGPVWINTNWMLYHGLRHYGHEDLAAEVKRDSLDLIRRCGFREYFSPVRAEPEGLGAKRFTWSAALLLDLLLAGEPDPPTHPTPTRDLPPGS